MNITVTVPDAQAGALGFYRRAGTVHVTKAHEVTASGGSASIMPYDAVLADVLTALVTATTITAAQRTAFTTVLSAINAYATMQSGL